MTQNVMVYSMDSLTKLQTPSALVDYEHQIRSARATQIGGVVTFIRRGLWPVIFVEEAMTARVAAMAANHAIHGPSLVAKVTLAASPVTSHIEYLVDFDG